MTNKYLPIYWLSALGYGGLMVTFFILLHVNVPHPKTSIPTKDSVFKFINMDQQGLEKVAIGMMTKKKLGEMKAKMHGKEIPSEKIKAIKEKIAKNDKKIAKVVSNLKIQQVMTYIGVGGMIFSIFMFFRLFFWNLVEYIKFRKTEKFNEIKTTLEEVRLMAVPLTVAMGIKVVYLGGAIFIDGFFTNTISWSALIAYCAVGLYAIYIFGEYFSRILDEGSEEFITNNNLGQMLAIFAFAMISVGLMGPAALSNDPLLAKWSYMIAIAFGSISLFLSFLKFGNSMAPILRKGISSNGSVSILIIIPILTLFGVWGVLRMDHGLHHAFHTGLGTTTVLTLLTVIFALEIAFMIIGFRAMNRKKFFSRFVYGKEEHDPSAFALICPLVAFYVWGMFWLHAGLVKNSMLDKWGLFYILIFGALTLIQAFIIYVYFQLNKKLLGSCHTLKSIELKDPKIIEEK